MSAQYCCYRNIVHLVSLLHVAQRQAWTFLRVKARYQPPIAIYYLKGEKLLQP